MTVGRTPPPPTAPPPANATRPEPARYHAAPRIVAAGTFASAAGQPRDRLRATIVLDPVLATGASGVTLKEWPERVHEWLAAPELRLHLSALRPAQGSGCAVPDSPVTIGARPLGRRGFSPAEHRALLAVWADAMLVVGHDWTHVERFIGAARPQPGAGPATSPCVAGLRRADAAVALTLDRGGRVLARLCGRDPPPRTPRASPPPPRSDRLLQFAAASEGGGWGGLASLSDAQATLMEPAAHDPEVARFLAEAARDTQAMEAARLAYLDARGSDPLSVEAFAAFQAGLPRGPAPLLLAQALAAGDSSPIEESLTTSRAAQSAPHDEGAMRANIDQADAAAQAEDAGEAPLLALRSYPSLERLFGFAFDVSIELPALLRGLGVARLALHEGGCLFATGDKAWDAASQFLAYAFLSIDPGTTGEGAFQLVQEPVWTTARLRLGPSPATRTATALFAEALAFTPCTREEMDRRAIGANAPCHATLVQQIEGVVDLGQTTPCAGGDPPRYEITSLDALSAIQGEAATARWNQIRAVRAEAPDDVGTRLGPLDGGELRLVTGGLALIDRQRSETARTGFTQASHADTCTTPRVLDADDLTVGYRLDVATAGRGGALDWRSLMRRQLQFTAAAAPGNQVTAMLGRLFDGQGLGGDWRATLDEAVCRFLLRVPDAEAGRGQEPRRLHAEEVLGPWSGDPLGLAAVADETDAGGLDIGITMSLPQDQTAARPPRLRFGWRYRVGLRAAYLGGVSALVSEAAATYGAHEARLTLPQQRGAAAPAGGWMFRRQESIGRPMLALPQVEVAQSLPPPSNGVTRVMLRSPAPVPMAGHMVVRRVTSAGGTSRRQRELATERTRRVVLPPMMPLHFCGLHDVFANAEMQPFAFDVPAMTPDGLVSRRVTGTRPRDGLRGVDFSAAWGGFPVLGTAEPAAGQTARGDEDDVVELYTADPARPAPPRWDPGRGTPRGDAVFRLRQGGTGERPQPYFPDPAAATMIISLGRRGTGGREPIAVLEVPIYADARPTADLRQRGYPDVVPIVIDLLQAAPPVPASPLGWRGGEAARAALWLFDPSQPDPSRMPREGQPRPAGIAVRWVEVRLLPGEDLELSIWCAPSPRMTAIFDATEAAAALLTQHGFACAAPGAPAGMDADAAARAGFMAMAGCSLPATQGAVRESSAAAIGGLPLPSEQTIDCLGAQVAATMRRHPIPEIASVIEVRVTAALDRPLAAPALLGAGETRRLRALRVRSAGLRTAVLGGPTVAPAGAFADPAGWTLDAEEPAASGEAINEILFAGRVAFTRRECESLELRVTGPFLSGGKFDDPQRGRTRQQRASGLWPQSFEGAIIDGRSVFGFDVWPDGRCALPKETTSLLRFDNLPDTGPDWIDLLAEQRRVAAVAAGRDRAVGDLERVVHLPAFPDGKARRIQVSPVVVARHDGLMTTRYGERFEERSRVGDPVFLWVPAMQRPDPPAVLTPIPAFVFTTPGSTAGTRPDPNPIRPGGAGSADLCTTSFETLRQSMVRILCERPWFTSGEGERLGIVLWPPQIFEPGPTSEQLRADRVQHAGSGRLADIAEFPDEALGPGGSFVTRWGADPVRGGAAPQGWLMTAQQFPDARAAPRETGAILAEGHELGPVVIDGNLPMPLPTGAGGAGAATPGELVVTVLSYQPRFDPNMEQWYADVPINVGDAVTPFVRLGLVRHQPCAPRGLRLSEPVVAWTQVLPERRLKATVIKKASPGRFEALLEVELQGPGTDAPARPSGPGQGPGVAADSLVEPRAVVNLRLTRSEPLPDGGATDIVLWEQLDLAPSFGPNGLLWQIEGIELPEDPLSEESAARRVRYTVHAEEVERYPTVVGLNGSEEAGQLASTGPRFVGVLHLARAAAAGVTEAACLASPT
jgi:hypothetical protein